MADVFLSYKKEERALAEGVVTALEAAGFSVWWDNNLTPRNSWDVEIEREIKTSKAVLVLWSALSVGEASFVRNEAGYALAHKKLVPVRIAECDLPLRFRDVQTADLLDWRYDNAEHAEWRKALIWISALVGRAPRSTYTRTGLSPTSPPPYEKTTSHLPQDHIRNSQYRRVESLAFIGRFKTGRSSLLNALLGPICGAGQWPFPTDHFPTLLPFEIRYSDRPHFRPVFSTEKFAQEAISQYWTLEKFHEMSLSPRMGRQSEIDRVEVGLPSDMLRNGLRILDFPGLTESARQDAASRAAIRSSDAVVVVFRSDTILSYDQLEYASEHIQLTHKVFVVVNVFHQKNDAHDRLEELLRTRMTGRDILDLDDSKSLLEQDVFFIDVGSALEAVLNNNSALAVSSGFRPFQQRLSTFLLTAQVPKSR